MKYSTEGCHNTTMLSKYLPLGVIMLALWTSGCETALTYKPGASALQQGDQTLQTGNKDAASAAYRKALGSSFPDVRGQAAYNLAQIEKAKGNVAGYKYYLEIGSSAEHVPSKLQLATLYNQDGTVSTPELAALYQSLAADSALANISLLRMSNEAGDTANASKYAKAAEALLKSQIADNGDVTGDKSVMLAKLYTEFAPYFPNSADVEALYRDAIAKGNSKAAENLAKYWLQTGKRQASTEQDVFALMIQAAEAGNPSAIKYVASAYEKGTGIQQDMAKAVYWYGKTPDGLKTGTSMNMAQSAMEQNPKAALPFFQKAADQGSLEAMLMVDAIRGASKPAYGDQYEKQDKDILFKTVKKLDKKYGQKYPQLVQHQYVMAANAGSGDAALQISKDIEAGDAGKSVGTSQEWLEKAARLGSGKAMITLARRLKIGEGTPPDEKAAFAWFKKSAEAGQAEGQYETGMAYARGTGVEKNAEKAKYWLGKAQTSGYNVSLDVLNAIPKN